MKHRNVSLFVPHSGCPHTCIFCNQCTISGRTENLKTEDIVSTCETAIANSTGYTSEESEIAFFGGSFTAIDRDLMISYLKTAAPYVGKNFSGIRVSTRPDAISSEILDILREYGVTAIELGAQSMDDGVLKLNERGHTSSDTENAASLIKEYGFSLGLQMMTGLYGSDNEKDIYTAERFISIRPDTVRIYPTVVLGGTALEKEYIAGRYSPADAESASDLCAELIYRFFLNGIRVIRVGLHSGGGVDGGYVAGVYHPAFGEICESKIYSRIIKEELENFCPGNYTLEVPAGEASKAAGHKGSNKSYFSNSGYELKIKENPELTKYQVRIVK